MCQRSFCASSEIDLSSGSGTYTNRLVRKSQAVFYILILLEIISALSGEDGKNKRINNMFINYWIIFRKQESKPHKHHHENAGKRSPENIFVEEVCDADEQKTEHKQPIYNHDPCQAMKYVCKRPFDSVGEEACGRRPPVDPRFFTYSGKTKT